MTITRIDHSNCKHPRTKMGNYRCRKLMLTQRPIDVRRNPDEVYTLVATDKRGFVVDLDDTPEGDSWQTDSVEYVVWVLNNLRYGIKHDWDAEMHTLERVAEIEISTCSKCSSAISPSGWVCSGVLEVHTINPDGSRTMSWRRGH